MIRQMSSRFIMAESATMMKRWYDILMDVSKECLLESILTLHIRIFSCAAVKNLMTLQEVKATDFANGVKKIM